MVKKYFKSIILVAIAISVFGLISPMMISASDDFSVVAGIVFMACAIPVLYFLLKNIINQKGERIK